MAVPFRNAAPAQLINGTAQSSYETMTSKSSGTRSETQFPAIPEDYFQNSVPLNILTFSALSFWVIFVSFTYYYVLAKKLFSSYSYCNQLKKSIILAFFSALPQFLYILSQEQAMGSSEQLMEPSERSIASSYSSLNYIMSLGQLSSFLSNAIPLAAFFIFSSFSFCPSITLLNSLVLAACVSSSLPFFVNLPYVMVIILLISSLFLMSIPLFFHDVQEEQQITRNSLLDQAYQWATVIFHPFKLIYDHLIVADSPKEQQPYFPLSSLPAYFSFSIRTFLSPIFNFLLYFVYLRGELSTTLTVLYSFIAFNIGITLIFCSRSKNLQNFVHVYSFAVLCLQLLVVMKEMSFLRQIMEGTPLLARIYEGDSKRIHFIVDSLYGSLHSVVPGLFTAIGMVLSGFQESFLYSLVIQNIVVNSILIPGYVLFTNGVGSGVRSGVHSGNAFKISRSVSLGAGSNIALLLITSLYFSYYRSKVPREFSILCLFLILTYYWVLFRADGI